MATKGSNEKPTSRRAFVKNSIALSTGVIVSNFENNNSATQYSQPHTDELSSSEKEFMKMFNLKYPIVQAPTAGPAGEALAIAVTNAGSMGALPLTWDTPLNAYQKVVNVKAATKGSFYVNYVLNFVPNSIDKALEAGASVVQFSWGMPSKDLISKVRAAGAKMGIQVTSMTSAKTALDLGADYLVCQGKEAGGHVQAHFKLMDALNEVLKVAGKIPVLASGGIATGHDIRRVLTAGASGAVLGSRFVATKESNAHTDYKEAMVKANSEDTVYTTCFYKGGWKGALHRVIRNNTFSIWEAAGCPTEGERPGEKDIIATLNDTNLERYSGNSPFHLMKGNVTDLAMYAGEGLSNINDIPSAGELIHRLWKEYENK